MKSDGNNLFSGEKILTNKHAHCYSKSSQLYQQGNLVTISTSIFFSKTKFNRRNHMITSNSAIANKGYLQYQPQSELLQFVHHRFVPEKEVVT
jgi:hypothetical protein